MANDSRIGILVEARDKASAELKKINSEIKNLGNAGKSSGGGIFAADLQEITSRALGANEALGLLSKGAVAVGVAMAAFKGAQMAFEMGKAASGAMALRDSFDDLAAGAGESSDALLSAMREAARGTISDTDLILSANRAMLLGVSKDAESMSKLIEIAAVRGRAMGLSTAQAFNDIVTGIGRASPLILDNLGITIDAESAYAKYAETIGTTAEALDDQQRKQVILNEVIASSAPLLKDNATQAQEMGTAFQRMDASLQNAKQALGELFTPYAARFAESLADAVDGATESLRAMSAAMNISPELNSAQQQVQTLTAELGALSIVLAQLQSNGAASGVLLGPIMQQMPEEIRGNVDAMQAWIITQIEAKGRALELAQASRDALQAINDMGSATDSTVAAVEHWGVVTGKTAQAQQELISAQRQAQAEADLLAAKLEEVTAIGESGSARLRSSYQNIIDVIGVDEALRRYQDANTQLQGVIAMWVEMGYSVEQVDFYTKAWIDNIASANSALSGTVGQLSNVEQLAASAAAQIKNSFIGIANLAGAASALGGYRKATQELDAQLAIWQQLGYEGDELEFRTAAFVDGIRDANSELQKTYTSAAKIPTAVSSATQAFDSLKSKISGLLSGALSSGIDLENILGRQDAIEEPARRLADIAVNGFNSPWTKYFQEQFPQLYEQLATSGNPRQAAASILREFEAGLRPELLDRETAKERVRQLLLGDSNIEGLAASIAQELSAEFGGQFSQAQILQTAQQALGQSAAGGLDISTGISAAPGTASKVLGQVEAQFASETAVNKAKAIGAAFARNLFNGYDEAAGGMAWWDRLLAIITRQQVEAGA